MDLPFNVPFRVGNEEEAIASVLQSGKFSGHGPFTEKSQEFLQNLTGADRVLLTQSATSGLEMAMLLADVKPGDEVILPSFTFSSCATAVVREGAVPVFVDVDIDSKNIAARFIEPAITEKTKVILPVHYAGNACEMDDILDLARKHNLFVVEDAAQSIGSTYKEKALGGIGDMGVYSFHDTKNITSGEGGALLVNNPKLSERAEVIWEKGTNRKQFIRGEVDKYGWVDVGSSFLPSEITAAMLWTQLQQLEKVTNGRKQIWDSYYLGFENLEIEGKLKRPTLNTDGTHNAHIFCLMFNDEDMRNKVLAELKSQGIHATFHYTPLHDSPAGRRFGRAVGSLKNTAEISQTLLRLPMWMGFDQVDRVVDAVSGIL